MPHITLERLQLQIERYDEQVATWTIRFLSEPDLALEYSSGLFAAVAYRKVAQDMVKRLTSDDPPTVEGLREELHQAVLQLAANPAHPPSLTRVLYHDELAAAYAYWYTEVARNE
jgi:hypothetical protein